MSHCVTCDTALQYDMFTARRIKSSMTVSSDAVYVMASEGPVTTKLLSACVMDSIGALPSLQRNVSCVWPNHGSPFAQLKKPCAMAPAGMLPLQHSSRHV
jgi:hypothetical protein